jgi:hypothetical protein
VAVQIDLANDARVGCREFGGTMRIAIRSPEVSGELTRLLTAAATSTFLSTLLALIFGGEVSRVEFHALFVTIIGLIGLLRGAAGIVIKRYHSGVVFIFFLFEPIGRILLRQEVAPSDLGMALVLGFVTAMLFGNEGPLGEDGDQA